MSQKEDTWFELANTGSGAVDISGWFVQNAESSQIFTIPARNNSGYLLAPGEYTSFHKLQSALALSRTGGKIVLRRLTQVIDMLSFPALPSGVSFGAGPTGSGSLQVYCVPTEQRPNGSVDWNPSLTVQSGTLRAEGKVTVNVEVTLPAGQSAPTHCSVDFGDGTGVESCNPPSHSFTHPGFSSIQATISNYCGTTVTRSLMAEVASPVSAPVSTQITYLSVVTSSSTSSVKISGADSCTPSTFGDVTVNEFLPKPSGGDEWVELLNASSSPADLCGWFLDDAEHGSKPFSLMGLSISPHGLLVIDRLESHIALNDTGDRVRLFAPTSAINQEPDISNTKLVQDIAYDKAKNGESYSLEEKGEFTWAKPTPGSLNFTQKKRIRALVTHVVDGDTLDVRYDPGQDIAGLTIRIRFLGIDAPELHVNGSLNPDGIKAADYIQSLLENKEIELEFDTNLFDVYGRTLAYLYLDGQSLEKMELERGLAIAYLRFPFSKKDEYVGYQQEAMNAKVGLWEHGISIIGSGSIIKQSFSDSGSDLWTQAKIAPGHSGSIVISEIYPAPTKSGSLLDRQEWIELYNNSDQDFSLQGVTFDDSQNAGSKPFVFQGDLIIPAYQYAVLTKAMTHIGLNNSGDEVRLIDSQGGLLDSVKYPKVTIGQSYGIVEGESAQRSFCISDEPSPGEANECVQSGVDTKQRSSSHTITKARTRRHRSVSAKSSSNKTTKSQKQSDGVFIPLTKEMQELSPLQLEGDLLAAEALHSPHDAPDTSLPDISMLVGSTASLSGVAGWAMGLRKAKKRGQW